MAHKIGDRCLETFTSTGTGNIAVLGAVLGHQSLAALMATNGDTMDVVLAGGAQWEIVRITRVSATEFSRGTPYSSSTGSAIDFAAGTKEVWGDIPSFFLRHLNTVEITVTSAATADIGAVHGLRVLINGATGPITSLGTVANQWRFVRFNSTPTITHNGTTLALMGGLDFTAQAGDIMILASDVAGNYAELFRQRKLFTAAFNDIKQAASDTATGVVELLTNAEGRTGTDTSRAMTAAAHVAAHGPKFLATRAGSQALTLDTYTKIQVNSEDHDSDACYDPATNYRFTPNVAGLFTIKGSASCTTDTGYAGVAIYFNGAILAASKISGTGTATHEFNVSADIVFNGSSDYVELFGLASLDAGPTAAAVRFSGFRVGPT